MTNKKGKAFGNRKKESERPLNDFYETPHCLTKELLNCQEVFNETIENKTFLDPCCGKYAIGNILRKTGFGDYNKIVEKDLVYGDDFLLKDKNENYVDLQQYDYIIMNPPFKLFNDFVKKSKIQANKVFCIGKMDYFCTHDRNVDNLWEHLEWVLPFDRKVAYDKPLREDDKIEVGMMNSCWFVWNKEYYGYPKIKVLDIDKYVFRINECKHSTF